jgi:hypothetical protein
MEAAAAIAQSSRAHDNSGDFGRIVDLNDSPAFTSTLVLTTHQSGVVPSNHTISRTSSGALQIMWGLGGTDSTILSLDHLWLTG